ncbi:MAG: hypothetical protein H6822_28275 [Planctomycetaceae bacterium]|nr:hypothetical protein [Planctomycetales bacterium]MCB9926078.1 hypothetical protein [Planctomycetaceae bacterium]
MRSFLEAALHEAAERSAYVISLYRDTNSTLRTTLGRITERAGLELCPKLFQNLRSTRETELAEQFPMHVVCAWIGNSKAVAAKHYLQATEDRFAKRAQIAGQSASDNDDSDGQTQQETQELSAVCIADNACAFVV